MNSNIKRNFYFDLSLRVWAKDLIIINNFLELRLNNNINQSAGIQTPNPILLKDKRYYISMAETITSEVSKIVEKTDEIIELVTKNKNLYYSLNNKEVTVNIWIAALGKQSATQLIIPDSIIDKATQAKIEIFYENYTDLINGNPHKKWFNKLK